MMVRTSKPGGTTGDRVKAAREALRVTLEQLARAAKLDADVVRAIEANHTEPTDEEVRLLADMLGRGVDELLRGPLAPQADERTKAQRTVYYNGHLEPSTQRVTIAHELWHLDRDLASVAVGEHQCGIVAGVGVVQDAAREALANEFAGELLAPLSHLDAAAPPALFPRKPIERHRFVGQVHALAADFSVPTWFMTWRLRYLARWRKADKIAGTVRQALAAIRLGQDAMPQPPQTAQPGRRGPLSHATPTPSRKRA